MKCTLPRTKSFKRLVQCIRVVQNLGIDEHCTSEMIAADVDLHNSKYKYIGEGNRSAWLKDGCVIKIPSASYGYRANIRESQFWDKIKHTSVKRYFAPVIKSDPHGAWLMMPYAPLKGYPEDELDTGIAEYDTDLEKLGIDCFDAKRENYGVYGGSIVRIDYDECRMG